MEKVIQMDMLNKDNTSKDVEDIIDLVQTNENMNVQQLHYIDASFDPNNKKTAAKILNVLASNEITPEFDIVGKIEG